MKFKILFNILLFFCLAVPSYGSVDYLIKKSNASENFESFLDSLPLTNETRETLYTFLQGKGMLDKKMPKLKKKTISTVAKDKNLNITGPKFDDFISSRKEKTLTEKSALATLGYLSQACDKKIIKCQD